MRLGFIPAVTFAIALSGIPLLAGPQTGKNQAGAQMTDEEFLKGAYPSDTPGLVVPVVKRDVRPRYVPDAMRAKIQGTVEIQAIVGEDGKVARVRVTKSLDTVYGLDEQALAAARQWTFEPGRLDGRAVPVAIALVLEFRLH